MNDVKKIESQEVKRLNKGHVLVNLALIYVQLSKEEEQDAPKEFGDEYRVYMKKTPGYNQMKSTLTKNNPLHAFLKDFMCNKLIPVLGLLMLLNTSYAADNNDIESKMLKNYQEMDKIMRQVEQSNNKDKKHQLMMQHMRKMDENMQMMKDMHDMENFNKELSDADDAKMQQMHMLQKIHMMHQKNMMMEMMMEQMLGQHKLMMKND